jgi:hypothetical protein
MDDISTSNSFSNSQSIVLNAGDGTLAAPQVYPSDPFGLATDLGDANGDGHLDWITSSLNGEWRLSFNDGAGNFTLSQEFFPTTASSCALMLDFDNDGDGTEGAWGPDGNDAERSGAVGGASGECGVTTKSLANTCGG